MAVVHFLFAKPKAIKLFLILRVYFESDFDQNLLQERHGDAGTRGEARWASPDLVEVGEDLQWNVLGGPVLQVGHADGNACGRDV